MRFWDSSALIPIVVEESSTPAVVELYGRETSALVWWASEIECVSALARVEREGHLSASAALAAFDRLETFAHSWHTIEPAELIRQIAKRFLRVHPLRTADALQLGAAFIAAEGQPETLGFVCRDQRLLRAAQREGFLVVNPS